MTVMAMDAAIPAMDVKRDTALCERMFVALREATSDGVGICGGHRSASILAAFPTMRTAPNRAARNVSSIGTKPGRINVAPVPAMA